MQSLEVIPDSRAERPVWRDCVRHQPVAPNSRRTRTFKKASSFPSVTGGTVKYHAEETGDSPPETGLRPSRLSLENPFSGSPESRVDGDPVFRATAGSDGRRGRACALCRNVTPHTLRHTFGSVAGDLGFSELTIADGGAAQLLLGLHLDEDVPYAID